MLCELIVANSAPRAGVGFGGILAASGFRV